jgi:DNA-binding phage protein
MNNHDRTEAAVATFVVTTCARNGPSIELWIALQRGLIDRERDLGGVAREVAAGRQSLQALRSMNASVESDRELSRALLGAMRDRPA